LAGPAEDSEVHIKKGIDLRRTGNDQAALREFQQAYAKHKSPRSAAQLSLCEQAVGLWAEAEAHMTEALSAKEDPWVTKNRAVLESALLKTRGFVGRVEISGGPAGAQISAGGVPVGTLPMNGPISLNAGSVDLEVTAPGHRGVTRSFTLGAGTYQRISIRLEPLAAAAPPPTKREVSGLTGSTTRPEVPIVAPPVEDASVDEAGRPFYTRTWVWIAAGVVLAGAAVAIAVTAGEDVFPTPTDVREFR
jgi:hypothetical protein